ncbi:MAG: PAS domain-containing protein [Acetobacteraceae bacterium]|nr:PAS domain-containing protein [Acetobacteraceae bacterium]
MSLALRAVLLVLVALIPAALVQLHLDGEARHARIERTEGEALRLARLVAAQQGRIIEGARHLLSAVAASEVIQAAKPDPACDAYLARLIEAFPRYTAIWSVSLDGRAICSPRPELVVGDVSDRYFFRAALERERFTLGEIVQGRTTGLATLHAALPVRDAAGRMVAVAVVGLSVEWLNRELAAIPLPPNANLLLVDRTGRMVARMPETPELIGRVVPNLRADMLHGTRPDARDMVTLDGSRRMVGFVPQSDDPPGLYVGVGLDIDAAFADATAAARWTAALMLGSLLTAVLLLGITFQRVVTRPVEALLATARRWREGDWSARVAVLLRTGEFSRLAAAFNAMADEVEARERARGESELRIRGLMEVSPQIVFISDPDGRVTWINQHFTQATWREAMRAGLGASAGSFEVEARLRSDADGWRWMLARAAPLRDAEGRISAWIGVLADVHDLKLAQAEAADNAARLAATYANAPVGLALFDLRLRFVAVNEAMAALNGKPVEAHLGRRLEDVAPDIAARVEELFRGIIASGAPILDHELSRVGPDGEEMAWLCSFRPVPGPDGAVAGISASLFDITARKRAERTERLLMREVDHRAKNALAVVRSLVRLSAAEAPNDVDTLVEALEGRISAMTRAHTLLARSRWSGAELGELAREELPPDGRCELEGSPVRLTAEATQPFAMLLHELVTNAAQHGALSVPTGNVRLAWGAAEDGGVWIEWTERGGPRVAGPPEQQHLGTRLIDANATTLAEDGLERHWEPAGLRCVLRIGADMLAAPIAGQEAWTAQAVAATSLPPGLRVLVLEDEVLVALETARLLDAMGCRVMGPAFTVDDALELIARSEPPDAAVLDVDIRGISSAPVAGELRRRGVAVVVMSGYGAPPEGHDDLPLVDKPATQAALGQALAHALSRRLVVAT